MTGRIPQNFIDDLLSRVNIVDVVDSRIRLKKAGKNHHACCPFHNEKTPSFTVASDKQFYYCFGCGAKGNAIGFVMEYDHIDFPEAVELLAGTVGLEVPKEETSPFQQKQQQERATHYDLMNSASEFYQQQLRFHADKDAPVNYLKKRGLSGKAAKFFGIGFAPPGWDNLKNTLATDDDKLKALIDTGMLISKDDGKCYDRFRNRVVFPIRDVRGRTIAFGARTLGDDKPKYLNSPETSIFNKGHELYGLYECRQIRQPLKRFVVVEGYMDVVALHEFGVHYAVATLGTATSTTHLQKLFKIAPEIVFCFDGDAAGRKAAKRGLELVLPVLEDGQQIRFMFLPEGEDPDTVVRKEGKAGFEQRLQYAQGISEFLLQTIKQDIDDSDSLEGRARLAKLAAPMIQQIPGPALKSLFWQALADETRLEAQELKEMGQAEENINLMREQQQRENQISYTPNSAPSHQAPYEEYSPSYHEDEYAQTPTPANEHPLIKQAIALILHAPHVVQSFGDLAFLQTYEGHYSQLLQKLVSQLQQSPQQSLLDALSLLATDSDYQEYKSLTEHHNRNDGHLSQEQVANDCLSQLRIKSAKSIQDKLLKKASSKGGFKHLQSEEQQLFQWAKAIIELNLLHSKLIKAGGKLDVLSPAEQEKYRQLTG
ncbi:DNA primase [Bermanella sp. WJH001]|uniref:DNA primase n=1 Tax=Bermanella sp. WJH001 TaxID=3048005 RepID=UPI0024BD5F9E|nr:DNA primase [Bermanella sp. WJH001]MDJ1538165.1 DNA primase [Bermanella sp. WJH001]